MISSESIVIPVSLDSDINSFRFLVYDEKNGARFCNSENAFKEGQTIISFNLMSTFKKLNYGLNLKNISHIDLETLGKYFYGLPAKEFKKEVPWSIYQLIRTEYLDETELVNICKYITGSRPLKPISDDDLFIFIQRIANKFQKLRQTLQNRGDWSRFEKIEIPIFNYFLQRAIKGILVNKNILEEKLHSIDEEYYEILSILRKKYGYKHADTSNESLTTFLQKEDASNNLIEPDIFNYVRTHETKSEKYTLLHRLIKNNRSKGALLNIFQTDSQRVYPNFEISGTVTSRILVTDPNLQNLKKNHRDVLLPDIGSSLLYLDYSCFEPMIMASFSNDPKLITLCNSGDLYLSLASSTGFTINERKQFKILFLAFTFGMDDIGLVSLITELLGTNFSRSQQIFQNLFGGFTALAKWKEDVWSKTLKNGFSESFFGNRRYRLENYYDLLPDERRWSVNQVIQGSASYILKKAILEISNKYQSGVDILLPMHDAILVQINNNLLPTEKNNIVEIMKNEFLNICPNMHINVSEESFFIEQTKMDRPNV